MFWTICLGRHDCRPREEPILSQAVWLTTNGHVRNRIIPLLSRVIDWLGSDYHWPFGGHLRLWSNSRRHAWYSPHMCCIKGRDALLERHWLRIFGHGAERPESSESIVWRESRTRKTSVKRLSQGQRRASYRETGSWIWSAPAKTIGLPLDRASHTEA